MGVLLWNMFWPSLFVLVPFAVFVGIQLLRK